MHCHSRVNGFTLLEFLLSLTLALLLYAGVMTLYSTAITHFTQAMHARESDAQALAMLNLLQNEVSRAGAVSGPRYLMPLNTAIAVTDHTLHVAYQAAPKVGLLSQSHDHLELRLEPWVRHEKRQVLVLSNDSTLEKATVSEAYNTAEGEVIKLTQPLKASFGSDTSVGRWVDNTYSLDEATHQLVVKNSYNEHLHLFESVQTLQFREDVQAGQLKGVFISFEMGDAQHPSRWFGYAPVWSQLA